MKVMNGPVYRYVLLKGRFSNVNFDIQKSEVSLSFKSIIARNYIVYVLSNSSNRSDCLCTQSF